MPTTRSGCGMFACCGDGASFLCDMTNSHAWHDSVHASSHTFKRATTLGATVLCTAPGSRVKSHIQMSHVHTFTWAMFTHSTEPCHLLSTLLQQYRGHALIPSPSSPPTAPFCTSMESWLQNRPYPRKKHLKSRNTLSYDQYNPSLRHLQRSGVSRDAFAGDSEKEKVRRFMRDMTPPYVLIHVLVCGARRLVRQRGVSRDAFAGDSGGTRRFAHVT